MTKALFKALSPKRYKQAATQESVPTSYPLHKNAEFIRAVMAVESGESSDIFPPGFPISGLAERITAQDRMGRTALHWLATRGHAKCVNLIMERLNTEDDAIITDHDGRTAIHEAVIQNNIAVLDEFLKYEMARREIDRIDRNGRHKRTALHWAALGRRDEILQKLIDGGANLELTDERGQTALRVATSTRNSESKWIIILALIAKGGGNKVIEELIRKGEIIPNEIGREGDTLLHHAVKKGNQSVARTLCEIGSFVHDAKDWSRSTPLAYACESGDEAMVKLLLDEGANPNARAAVHPTRRPPPPSTERWARGAFSHGTILVKAARRPNVAIVNRLIAAGAEVDARDPGGGTALLLAAIKGHVHVVEALINSGANINVQDASGSSPLGMAAKEGHEPVVKLLLERNAEVNTIDKQGRSPLSYAAGSGSKDCVGLLLDAGAMVDIRDENHMTPRSWASHKGHKAVAGILFEKEDSYKLEKPPVPDHKDEDDLVFASGSQAEEDRVWVWWLHDRAEYEGWWGKHKLPKSIRDRGLVT